MSNAKNKKNVVVICGGTGGYVVLSGIKRYPHVWPQAIVTATDSGGSSGRLRKSPLGSLPPGDIRQANVALVEDSERQKLLIEIFNYRFRGLAGDHNLGNLIFAALEDSFGDFEKANRAVGQLLGIRGSVIPVTNASNINIKAILEDGTVVHGEHNIDVPRHDPHLRVAGLVLEPPGELNPEAREAIVGADLIVIGPGDLYTSILPNLLMGGMKEALKEARAPKVYVVNLMTKRGETLGFAVGDFVRVIEDYLGKGVLTHVLYNVEKPDQEHLDRYWQKEGTEFAKLNESSLPGGPAYLGKNILAEVVGPEFLIRHDPNKLAEALISLIS